jgi:hypothetical protein
VIPERFAQVCGHSWVRRGKRKERNPGILRSNTARLIGSQIYTGSCGDQTRKQLPLQPQIWLGHTSAQRPHNLPRARPDSGSIGDDLQLRDSLGGPGHAPARARKWKSQKTLIGLPTRKGPDTELAIVQKAIGGTPFEVHRFLTTPFQRHDLRHLRTLRFAIHPKSQQQ